ncbi:olfactory receptor 10A7-like [Emydura macquarii macquarii]|uniref:olfactory receptor 10A7-like n=1 Tax=Emydura macquarii macquarii TaxID=1129001 RepID=UPI00352AC83E
MTFDHYLAICNPLHYAPLMNFKFCVQLATGSWIIGFLTITITVLSMLTLTFCGPNTIDHFFCDLMPVLKLSRTDTHLVAFVFSSVGALPLFLLTVDSYFRIVVSILRINHTTGRKKPFSSCPSHLIMVTIFCGTLLIVYLTVDNWRELNKVASLVYTVLTPMINPLNYSLRNKEVKEALRSAANQRVIFRRSHRVPGMLRRPFNAETK